MPVLYSTALLLIRTTSFNIIRMHASKKMGSFIGEAIFHYSLEATTLVLSIYENCWHNKLDVCSSSYGIQNLDFQMLYFKFSKHVSILWPFIHNHHWDWSRIRNLLSILFWFPLNQPFLQFFHRNSHLFSMSLPEHDVVMFKGACR